MSNLILGVTPHKTLTHKLYTGIETDWTLTENNQIAKATPPKTIFQNVHTEVFVEPRRSTALRHHAHQQPIANSLEGTVTTPNSTLDLAFLRALFLAENKARRLFAATLTSTTLRQLARGGCHSPQQLAGRGATACRLHIATRQTPPGSARHGNHSRSARAAVGAGCTPRASTVVSSLALALASRPLRTRAQAGRRRWC